MEFRPFLKRSFSPPQVPTFIVNRALKICFCAESPRDEREKFFFAIQPGGLDYRELWEHWEKAGGERFYRKASLCVPRRKLRTHPYLSVPPQPVVGQGTSLGSSVMGKSGIGFNRFYRSYKHRSYKQLFIVHPSAISVLIRTHPYPSVPSPARSLKMPLRTSAPPGQNEDRKNIKEDCFCRPFWAYE